MKKWITTVLILTFLPLILKSMVGALITSIKVTSFLTSNDLASVTTSILLANIIVIEYGDVKLKEDKYNLIWTVILLIVVTIIFIFSAFPTDYIKDISMETLKWLSIALLVVSTIYCGLTIYELEKVRVMTND